MAQTAWHIFNDVMEGTRASIAAHPDGLQAAVISAESVTLDMPPGRGDALWELMAGTAGGSPELDRIRRNIRSMISNVWMDPVQQRMGLDTESARVFSWIIVMGFWGMRQLVRGRRHLARSRRGRVQRSHPPHRSRVAAARQDLSA